MEVLMVLMGESEVNGSFDGKIIYVSGGFPAMFDEQMVYIIHGYDWMIRINHWKTVDYINKYYYMCIYIYMMIKSGKTW